MNEVYVVGHITVKDEQSWAEYRAAVPATLAPWGAELVFRGEQIRLYAGDNRHPDIVVIRFPDAAAADGWFHSPAYQALLDLRARAAEVVLVSYQA